MKALVSKVDGYKTYIVCIVTIIYTLVSVWNGSMDWNSASKAIEQALMAATIRHAISKTVTTH